MSRVKTCEPKCKRNHLSGHSDSYMVYYHNCYLEYYLFTTIFNLFLDLTQTWLLFSNIFSEKACCSSNIFSNIINYATRAKSTFCIACSIRPSFLVPDTVVKLSIFPVSKIIYVYKWNFARTR